MAYRHRKNLEHRHREGLRRYLAGASTPQAAAVAGISPVTMYQLIRSPAGRAFLEAERDRIDSHRTLLAASLPHLALLNAFTDSKQVIENIGKLGDSQDSETNLRHIAAAKEARTRRKRATMPQETPDPAPPE